MGDQGPFRTRQGHQDQTQRYGADRQVDIEDPAPRQRIGDHPAEHRPGHAAQSEDAGKQALIAAALTRRDEIGDSRLRQHH
jgi:hypothetical protein